jgi:hypothetical protein
LGEQGGEFVLTTSMVFKTELENLLAKAIEHQVEVMSSPHAVVDFPNYKYHVGIITGLRQALELAEEAESVINKRERGA